MTVLTTLFAGLWAYGYLAISAMACAWSVRGNCNPPAPWTLLGDDLLYMFAMPAAVFLGLLGVTIWLWRKVS